MKIGALIAAGFFLSIASSALTIPAHAEQPPHVIQAWKLDLQGKTSTYRLMTTNTAVVAEMREGRYGKPPVSAASQTLAFSDVGCVSPGIDTITLYPTKRWGVTNKNLTTGKISPDASISMSFASVQQAKIALRALEDASPRIAQKVGACKDDVDLYGLSFGTVSLGDAPFSWQQDSGLFTTDYRVWTAGGVFFAEANTPKIIHAFYKLALSRIGCVKLRPRSNGMPATLYIYPALSDDVLWKDVEPGKQGTFTASDIDLNFNDTEGARTALHYLQRKSRVFSAKLDACPWPGAA